MSAARERHRYLARPQAYVLTQRAFGANRARSRFVSRFVKPKAGDRVLDIGCGTGDILDHLPKVDYVGFDLSEEYVAAAVERYGAVGTFHAADVLDADLQREPPFDIIMATGVLHHLDDSRADHLMALAAANLQPGGRFLSWDGAYVDGQPRLAKWLLDRDRGEFVRRPDEYVAIASRHFGDVRHSIVGDFLRMPYTHCVLDVGEPGKTT